MKRIFHLHRDATQMLGKHRAYLKPELFMDALAFAQRGLFDEYFGNTKEYRPGKALPRIAYQVTTAVTDALHPFLKEVRWGSREALIAQGLVGLAPGQSSRYLRLNSSGRFELPADWVHPTAWVVPGATEAVQLLDDNEVVTTVNSLIAPPSPQHPMLEVVQGGLRLLGGSTEISGKYLSFPPRAVYAVDYVDGEPVYNDSKSVDVLWPASRDNQLLTRLLSYPALVLRDQLVQQSSQELTDRGA